MFAWAQIRGDRIAFPYLQVAGGAAVAAAVGAGFALVPDINPALKLALGLLFIAGFVVALFAFRVIPEKHREPLIHTARSVFRGTPAQVNPRRGLRNLRPAERKALRRAVKQRVPPERLAADGARGKQARQGEAAQLVKVLRRAGRQAGVPVGQPTRHDPLIGRFLFADAPQAVRDATMRRLLDQGADSGELRALEDFVAQLRRVPADAWKGRPARGDGGGRKANADQ
jgi:hypothetical protein